MQKQVHSMVDAAATGNAIKTTMDAKGLSVRDIAASANVSTQVVYKWINGLTVPGIDNLVILRELLDTPIDSLIKLQEYPTYSIPEYMLREEPGSRLYACKNTIEIQQLIALS